MQIRHEAVKDRIWGSMARKQSKEEFFALMRKRFQEAETAENENRIAAMDDLRFIHNYESAQWPIADQASRQADKRPMLTHNLLRKFLRSMMGAMQQTKPGLVVKPVDSEDDVITADIYTDLIRQIEKDIESPAEQAYNKAYEGAVGNAFGYIRVVAGFVDDTGFDQKIQIQRVENPWTVLMDPGRSTFLGTDQNYCFISGAMDRDAFHEKYPRATPGDDWQTMGDTFEKWYGSDTVRITEYFWAVPVTKTIAMLEDLSIIELTNTVTPRVIEEAGHRIVRTRAVQTKRYMWAKVSGQDILEPARPWPGKYIPIIPVFGDEVNIEGKRVLFSFFRDAKDPQQMYNFWLSAATEIVALSPKTPYIGTAKHFNGFESLWKDSNIKNYAYLPYNADKNTKIPPTRQNVSQVPGGHVTMMGIAQANIMNTQGQYEASLGEQGNERSGKAIYARQDASARVTFSYLNNFHQSLLLVGHILTDLIPHIYDTNRIVRLRGPEDAMRFFEVNVPYFDPITGTAKIAHDLSQGNFDTELDVSPAQSSRRERAVREMIEMIQYIPDAGPVIADLIVKNMDFPGAQEIADRLRSTSQQQQQPPQ